LAATGAVLVAFAGLNLAGAGGGGDGDGSSPTTTAATTTTTIPALPACAEADVQVPDDPEVAWATLLVDTARALPADYGSGDLRNISDAGFPFTDGLAVRQLVVADLDALRQAAADNGDIGMQFRRDRDLCG